MSNSWENKYSMTWSFVWGSKLYKTKGWCKHYLIIWHLSQFIDCNPGLHSLLTQGQTSCWLGRHKSEHDCCRCHFLHHDLALHCIWVSTLIIAFHFVSNLSDGTRDGGYSQLQGCFHATMFIFRTANIICIISNGKKYIDVTRTRYFNWKWRIFKCYSFVYCAIQLTIWVKNQLNVQRKHHQSIWCLLRSF